MKSLKLALLGFVSLAPAAIIAPAHADGNWYIGARGGVSVADDPKLNNTLPGLSGAAHQGNDIAVGINVGYDFGRVRIEGEVLHFENNVNKFTFANDGGLGAGLVGVNAADSGKTRATAGMVNMLYDFDFGQKGLVPYIGGGLGWSGVGFRRYRAVGLPIVDDTASVAAYQLIVGLRARISDALAMTADYRYFGTEDPRINDALGHQVNTDYHTQVFMVGLVWKFGAKQEKPSTPAAIPTAMQQPTPEAETVAAVEPAAAPAPVPEKVGPFTVYFDWNSAALSADAKAEIERAAAAAKDKAPVKLELKGYADSSGPEYYNTPLSKRRAAAVKAALIAEGVPADSIGTWGYGEDNLAVWTQDNVRERQNRRVEIVLK